FIDGGHSLDAALGDYRAWAGKIARSGLLAIHDVYPDPAAGGQAPAAIHRLALDSGLFDELDAAGSLRVLRRL
ncbi:MAG TPA: class I SAM-dependent methyltransferase, partial [Pseudohaliea sp.]|nr:class I SAM-dependent methyltransferase [Pseudohaliea sp.]